MGGDGVCKTGKKEGREGVGALGRKETRGGEMKGGGGGEGKNSEERKYKKFPQSTVSAAAWSHRELQELY